MANAKVSRAIAAPPKQVWAVLSSPQRFEEWLTLHTKWKEEPPVELSKGAKFTEVISMMGMPNTIEWTVDEYEKPRTLSISGTGMAGVKVSITIAVQAAGEGSKLDLTTDFEGAMIVGALGKAIEKQGQQELDKSIEQFKALL